MVVRYKHDLSGVLTHFDKTVGLDRIKVLHVNDSKIQSERIKIDMKISVLEKSDLKRS